MAIGSLRMRWRDQPEQPQRLLVGPVQVLDHEQQRPMPRRGQERVAQLVEHGEEAVVVGRSHRDAQVERPQNRTPRPEGRNTVVGEAEAAHDAMARQIREVAASTSADFPAPASPTTTIGPPGSSIASQQVAELVMSPHEEVVVR